jgi:streptomycin 6-kinase
VDAGHPLTLPRSLIEHIGIDAGRDAWIQRLPQTVADIASQWTLDVFEPFEPGGYCSWVVPARTPDGADVVLKVGWQHEEALHEADALALWDGDGAVRLLAQPVQLDRSVVLLLERAKPGVTLAQSMPEPDQDVVLCDLLRRLWRRPPEGHPFRPLSDMCASWVAEFRTKRETRDVVLDDDTVEAGLSMFISLAQPSSGDVVLCTDLHPENILSADREPWLAIDPKPYVGDPAYDVLQNMLNMERLRDDPVGLADRMAELTTLDRDRVRRWAFARFVVESIDKPWLLDPIRRLTLAL